MNRSLLAFVVLIFAAPAFAADKACEKKCSSAKSAALKACGKKKGAAASACKKAAIDKLRACLAACEAPATTPDHAKPQ